MDIEILHSENFQVSAWAGGTTTQLCIYPQGSEYAKRDFLFRISSATVDCECSTFTALPGVERIILPLKGTLHLYYRGHGEKFLRAFEQDRFDGGWETTSAGRAIDFNLMTRDGAVGEVDTPALGPGAACGLYNREHSILAVYAAQGECICAAEGREAALAPGCLAVIREPGELVLKNTGSVICRVVCARVTLP